MATRLTRNTVAQPARGHAVAPCRMRPTAGALEAGIGAQARQSKRRLIK